MPLTRRLTGRAGARFPALGASILLVVFAAAGIWFFAAFAPARRRAAVDAWHRDLSTRAEVRRDSLQRFFVDGLADAQYLSAYPAARQLLSPEAPGAPAPPTAPPAHLQEILDAYVQTHGIAGAVLWDAGGNVVVKSRDFVVEPACAASVREVVASGAPAVGFHLHEDVGALLTYSAPVRFADGIVRGVLVIAEDPRKWLYPLLSQPLAGTLTGESLLVGRDGADALFLSPLRGRPGPPLSVRRPLDDPEFAARRALDGSEAVGSFVDYRGVRVLAAGRLIPPSPWALVVKIDEGEAMADAGAEIRRTGLAVTGLLVATLGIAWGLRQKRQKDEARALTESETRLETILDQANDAVFVGGPEGDIRFLNRVCEEMYGYPVATLRGRSMADFPVGGEREAALATLNDVFRLGHLVFESEHVRADGSPFPVEVSARIVEIGGEKLIVAVVRDISERKRAEARILHLNRLLRTIGEINQLIVCADDRKALVSEACRVLVEHGDYRMAWIGFVDPMSSRVVPEARAGDGLSYLDGIEVRSDDMPEGRGPAGTAIRTGLHVVVPDIEADPSVVPWRERARENGFRSGGSFPLKVRGEFTGALSVYRSDQDSFGPEETALLDELAGDIGYALEALEIRDENRRAGEALRRAEERFRMAAEASNDVVYEWDLKERLEWWGDVDGLLGYGAGEFPRTLKGFTDSVHPEDLGRVWAAIEAHLEGRAAYAVEYRILRKDGLVRWWSARGTVARGPDGTNNRWVGTITDITERRRADEALRESETRFRRILENMADAYFRADVEGRLILLSPSVPRMYGYESVQEMVGLPAADLYFDPEEREAVLAEMRQAGRCYDRIGQGKKRDGTPFWVSLSARFVRDEQGRLTGTEGVIRDISERKRAEEALLRSETRYRTLNQRMLDGFVIVGMDGRILEYNDAFRALTGYADTELEALTYVDLTPVRWHGMERRILEEQVLPRGYSDVYEKEYRRKDGTIVPISLRTHLERNERGEPAAMWAIVRDVTEKKRAEETLEALNEQLEKRVEERTRELEAANREMEAFSYSVSHDLRTPLRAMDGFSRILLEDYEKNLDAEGRRLLGVIRANTVQMGSLIDDLLSFSRVGRQEMVRSDVDMEALAKAAFRELGPAGARVSFTVGTLPRASGDPALMRQVFLNLVSNALKFTAPKAERAVEVGARTEPARVVYWVKDNGVGFDMAYVNKLFGVFQRLHSAAEFEGTGVGLALVRRIINRHGGEVWAEGKVGEGATVSFSLPIKGGL